MEFHSSEHVYRVIPDLLGNKESDTPVIFHLKGISQDAFNDAVIKESVIQQNHSREEAAKLVAENSSKLVSDRVVKVENMTCDGKEITSYSDLCKYAPKEFVGWVVAVVNSTELLMEHEIKN